MKMLKVLLAAALAGIALYFIYSLFKDLTKTEDLSGPMSHLGSVRSALQIYYGDHDGRFPVDGLSCLVEPSEEPGKGRYLDKMPVLWDNARSGREYPHPPTSEVAAYPAGAAPTDTGKWGYHNDPSFPAAWGGFFIDCTHINQVPGGNGQPWSVF